MNASSLHWPPQRIGQLAPSCKRAQERLAIVLPAGLWRKGTGSRDEFTGATSKTLTKSSRHDPPSLRHSSRMICVSADIAPKYCSNSSNLSATRSSGTGWPPLDRSGSRISYRRGDLLVYDGACYRRGAILDGREAGRSFRNERFTGSRALEGRPPSKAAEGTILVVGIGETNPEHDFHRSLGVVTVGLRTWWSESGGAGFESATSTV